MRSPSAVPDRPGSAVAGCSARSAGRAGLAPRAHVPRGTSPSSCGCQRANVRPSPEHRLRRDTSPAERHPRHRSLAEQGWAALLTARASAANTHSEAVERTPCQPADVVSARNPDVTPSASTAILGSPRSPVPRPADPRFPCPSQQAAWGRTRGADHAWPDAGHSRSRRAAARAHDATSTIGASGGPTGGRWRTRRSGVGIPCGPGEPCRQAGQGGSGNSTQGDT